MFFVCLWLFKSCYENLENWENSNKYGPRVSGFGSKSSSNITAKAFFILHFQFLGKDLS